MNYIKDTRVTIEALPSGWNLKVRGEVIANWTDGPLQRALLVSIARQAARSMVETTILITGHEERINRLTHFWPDGEALKVAEDANGYPIFKA